MKYNKRMLQKIGLIGLGDLGQRLALQLSSAGAEVIISTRRAKQITYNHAVDPHLAINTTQTSRIKFVASIDEVLRQTNIIHFAAPSTAVKVLPNLSPEHIVVLHDSVMNESLKAISSRADSAQFVIAHCLMNTAARVFVEDSQAHSSEIYQHFTEISLNPKTISLHDHDLFIAQTQGVFALLINIGLTQKLEQAHEQGDLTSSASELYYALRHRESRWTETTLRSVLSNPELTNFIDSLSQSLAQRTIK